MQPQGVRYLEGRARRPRVMALSELRYLRWTILPKLLRRNGRMWLRMPLVLIDTPYTDLRVQMTVYLALALGMCGYLVWLHVILGDEHGRS